MPLDAILLFTQPEVGQSQRFAEGAQEAGVEHLLVRLGHPAGALVALHGLRRPPGHEQLHRLPGFDQDPAALVGGSLDFREVLAEPRGRPEPLQQLAELRAVEAIGDLLKALGHRPAAGVATRIDPDRRALVERVQNQHRSGQDYDEGEEERCSSADRVPLHRSA